MRKGIKKIHWKIKRAVIVLSAFAFYLLNCNGHLQAAHQNQPKDPNYAPGQLVIKLKQGKSLADIQELNLKYNITSLEKIFKDTPSPEETLKTMKKKLGELDTSHESWYWQLDKNSQEYKDYAAKIENEKEGLTRQIEAQKKLIARLEQRQKRAPSDAQTPGLDNIYLLNSDAQTNIPAMEAEYSANDAVEYAEPNYVVKAMMTPNDPYYSSSGSWGQSYDDLWGLKKIQAEKAWDISQGEGVVVAVVDSGIDYTHEDIADNIWENSAETAGNGVDDDGNGYVDDVKGYDFANSDPDPTDDNGHGTHVAGTIAASGNNSKGVIGVAYKAKVMALKGLDENGSGYDSNLASALQYAADNSADIINNSWGGDILGTTVIKEAIAYVYSKGCIIIAAAGNETQDAKEKYPASFSEVIAVSSTDSNGSISDFSNYGYKIDVSAPGGNSEDSSSNRSYANILSLRANNTNMNKKEICIVGENYYRARGTSMAAPHVAGLAALIISGYPNFTQAQVTSRIIGSADFESELSFYIGGGKINANNALRGLNLHPHLVIESVSAMKAYPASTADIIITLKNKGEDANSINSNLSINDTLVEITKDSHSFGDITAGAVKSNSDNPFKLSLNGHPISFGRYVGAKLSISDSKDYNKEEDFTVKITPSHKGFPFVRMNNEAKKCNIILADLDNDKKKEIIVYETGENLNEGNHLYVLTQEGILLNSNWPYSQGNYILSVSAGDINNDGYKDLVVDTYDDRTGKYKKIFLNNNAEQIGAKEIYFGTECTKFSVIADFNNDGIQDIIFLKDYGVIRQKVYAYDYQGNQLMSSVSIPNSNYIISVGDIDCDGYIEVVGTHSNGGNDEIFIVRHNGSAEYIPLDFEAYKNVTLGDINKDNDKEIVVYGNDTVSNKAYVAVYTASGEELWKKESGDSPNSKNQSEPVICNIDSDKELEILFYNKLDDVGALFAFNHDGTKVSDNYPISVATYNTFSGEAFPVVGDIDGDSDMEIVLTSALYNKNSKAHDYLINAWHHKGTIVNNWPKYTTKESADQFVDSGGLAIDDIDNDDNAELVLLQNGSSDKPKFSVNIFELGRTKAGFQWPMYHYNSEHTGCYVSADISNDTASPEGSIQLVNNSSRYTNTAQISLSLSASDDTGVTGYYLSENSSTPSADASEWIAVTSTASYSADVSYTLSSGDGTKTVYCWYKDAAGNISAQYKTSAILDTTAPVIAITSPTSNSTYSTSSSSISLGGTTSDATSGIKEVTWKSNKGGSGSASGTRSWSIANISLSRGANIITVTAKDNAGNEKSTAITITYTFTTVTTPNKPTNLKASVVSANQIKLTWKDNSNNETGFKLERKSGKGPYSEIAVISANTSTYNDSGLKARTSYSYRIRAYNSAGNSSYSNTTETTTKKQDTSPASIQNTQPARLPPPPLPPPPPQFKKNKK